MTDDEADSLQELAAELTRNADGERVREPFEPLIEDLGLDSPADAAEQILVYRESPDRECFVCGASIPAEGRNLAADDQYLVQRVNEADEPYPLTERTFHPDCWAQYREEA